MDRPEKDKSETTRNRTETIDEKFTRFLKQHPHAPSYKKDFAHQLRDNVGASRKELSLLTVAWKTGIAEQIAHATRITSSFAYQCARQVSSSMHVSREAAEWAVNMWCVCFGDRTLHKTCDVNLTELKEDVPLDLTSTQVGAKTSAEHEKQFRVQVRNGTRVITQYLGDDNVPTLVVPGVIGGMPARRVESDVFRDSSFVHVIMQPGITELGLRSFEHCLRLQQVVLPDGLRVIEKDAFNGCRALRRIQIPSTVVEIGEGAFANTALQGIVIPDSVKKLGDAAFENCSHLIDADIGAGITIIPEYLFSGCISLEEVDFPAGIERIERGAFRSCSSLLDLSIPEGTKFIGDNAFFGVNSHFRLVGTRNSVVEYYSKAHNVKALLVR